MRRAAFCVLCLLAAGCAAIANPIHAPSGRPGFAIDCGDPIPGWHSCYQKAGELCGAGGYEIVDRVGNEPSFAASLLLGASATRSLIITCK